MWLCIVGLLWGWLLEFVLWVVIIIELVIVLGVSVVLIVVMFFVGDGDSFVVVCLVFGFKLWLLWLCLWLFIVGLLDFVVDGDIGVDIG